MLVLWQLLHRGFENYKICGARNVCSYVTFLERKFFFCKFYDGIERKNLHGT